MNNITKNTKCPNSKIKKSVFIIQYRYHISQRINQIFEAVRLYCFAFTALAIDKTFTLRNFLSCKIEIVSMYFPIKIRMRTNDAENSVKFENGKFQSKINLTAY